MGEVCKLTISKFQTYMYVLCNTLFVHCENAKALSDGFSKRADWLVGRDVVQVGQSDREHWEEEGWSPQKGRISRHRRRNIRSSKMR